MPGTQELELVWSPAARDDLIRLRKVIEPHNPEAARRSAEAIKKGARLLIEHPAISVHLSHEHLWLLFRPLRRSSFLNFKKSLFSQEKSH
jgi:plasmid stabilization system protein ParE